MWVAASMIANVKRTQIRHGANAFGRFFGRILLACAATAILAAAARASQPAARFIGLRDGETLTYSVRWGLLPSVGRIKIKAEVLGSGDSAVMRVTTTTWTWGLARGLFPFDGRGESVYNATNGLLLSSSEWSTYRNKEIKNSITFDYGKMIANYSDDIHPEKSRTIRMPDGNPSDLILALIQTRNWKIAPGQSRDALVIFQDQFYPLTIRADDDPDFVVTSLGIFRAMVLEPRMEKTAPMGMFKRGSTVRVWITTDDERHLPVRFQVGFRFGTGTATLMDYTPPK
jgi:hypothetical protein